MALGRWADLRAPLGDKSLAEMEAEGLRCRQQVEGLPVPHQVIQELSEDELRSAIGEVENNLEQLREQATHVAGEREERARSLPSVAEAEERLSIAQQELVRIERLDRVLDRAAEHLEKAQERVHRDIAPRLAKSVQQSLARVTGARYVDVIVDPATLEVSVQEGNGSWRKVTYLSHGTQEQVYLLLRLALAEHLTQQDEVCPIMLDDVTRQCDAPPGGDSRDPV